MSMKCPACGKNHWGRCTDKSVALWKRMTAGEYVDGDRYLSDSREDVPAREFAREVNRLEKRCAALESENARLKEDKERLDWLEKWLKNSPTGPWPKVTLEDEDGPEWHIAQGANYGHKDLRAAIDAARGRQG